MPRLELTYNFGVDSYDLGSGYGHIAITAEDLDATLARLAEQGIEPERAPYSVREGGSRLLRQRSRRLPNRADRAASAVPSSAGSGSLARPTPRACRELARPVAATLAEADEGE